MPDRRRLLLFLDPAARHLARQIAPDRVARLRQGRRIGIAQQDIEPRQRADMRDAAPHLPGADDADAANLVHAAIDKIVIPGAERSEAARNP